jgi:large subunit GTPase 1
MEGPEVQHNENMAFLEWRRDLALVEENNVKLAITPFEKNIEVWKQLWRVIEKSHILLQIVDARNPYFFYSADLEKYISECKGDKEFILIINKADYLTPELLTHWNEYFKEKGVDHVFVSALKEQQKLDTVIDEESEEDSDEFQ